MENSVNTVVGAAAAEAVSAPEPATVFAFAPDADGDSPVDAGQGGSGEADLQGEELQASGKTVGAEDSAQGVGGPDQAGEENTNRTPSQAEIGHAFGRESKRLQEKYRREYEDRLTADPAYLAGRRMIEDIAEREGIAYEQAAQKAEERWIEAVAAREGVSVNVARLLVQQAAAPKTPEASTEAQAPDTAAQAAEILEGLLSAPKPDGFDLDAAMQDPAFVQLATEMSPTAAMRVYAAEQRAKQAPQSVAERLQARQQIPQSLRPQQAATPVTDWGRASEDQFYAEKERRRKTR